ncbi:hypothetical protein [Nocardioides lijunqiniae]|uniref:hypothetical protein n=1 Tax=Nocardioides lijunqiniae TaxID=2760832 RepID=UPI001877DD78|nr:hypothetical protein [Nocardioides lijunqiniae]
MTGEIQLISDGDGLAVVGQKADVEAFFADRELSETSRPLELHQVKALLNAGSGVAGIGSEWAATHGRWMKLTEDSYQRMKKEGLRKSRRTGLRTGVFDGGKGQTGGFTEFLDTGRSFLANPANLAGAAGVMAQLSAQAMIGELKAHLDAIEVKVDEVLAAQTDMLVSGLVGTGRVIDDCLLVRELEGGIDERTWAKVQGSPAQIHHVLEYALTQLGNAERKLRGETSVRDLAVAAQEAEGTALEWLAVVARCVQLLDEVDVLELDIVLSTDPGRAERRLSTMRQARARRLEQISARTESLVGLLNQAAERANARVLLHPSASPAVVEARNHAATRVQRLNAVLGGADDEPEEDLALVRTWTGAMAEVRVRTSSRASSARDRAFDAGAGGAGAAARLGAQARSRAARTRGRLAGPTTTQAWRRLKGPQDFGELSSPDERELIEPPRLPAPADDVEKLE